MSSPPINPEHGHLFVDFDKQPKSYYERSEVSNSNLTEFDKLVNGSKYNSDATYAFRTGNLVDAMLTEPERLNYISRQTMFTDDQPEIIQYSENEWIHCKIMAEAFKKSDIGKFWLQHSEKQKVFVDKVDLYWGQMEYSLTMRCKYDLWLNEIAGGCDIKTTAARTREQFIQSIDMFNYDRSRVLYMLLSKTSKDILLAISKHKPHPVFKVAINKGDAIWQRGYDKLMAIAFQYYSLNPQIA